MEATPEPEPCIVSPAVVPQLEETVGDTYFHVPFDEAPGLEALSTAATANFEYIRQLPVTIQSPGDMINGSLHSTNNLDFILNPAGPDGTIGIYYNFRAWVFADIPIWCSFISQRSKLNVTTPLLSKRPDTCRRPRNRFSPASFWRNRRPMVRSITERLIECY